MVFSARARKSSIASPRASGSSWCALSAPPRCSRNCRLSTSIMRMAPAFMLTPLRYTRHFTIGLMPFDTANLVAIDTHVHIESDIEGNAADEAAKKYFGDSGVPRGRKELAEYYRARKIGCVVFSVDERLTGRPQVSNDDVADFAEENS